MINVMKSHSNQAKWSNIKGGTIHAICTHFKHVNPTLIMLRRSWKELTLLNQGYLL